MHLSDFLDFDAIKTGLPGRQQEGRCCSSSRISPAQRLGLDSAAILASLTEREQLGSTGFGQGVAIPHGKVEGLRQLLPVRAARRAARLQGDRRPAGRSRLSPAVAARRGAEHLKALAAISRVTRHAADAREMRGARSRDALAAVLMGADERDAA